MDRRQLKILVAILAGVAFIAGLIIEPTALAQIARICLGGHCGIQRIWIEAAAAVIVFAVAFAIGRRKRAPPPKRRVKPKPGTMLAKNVPPKPRRAEKP